MEPADDVRPSWDTYPRTSAWSQAVRGEGVVLFEPCEGLRAGLEAVLRNRVKVRLYIYSDILPSGPVGGPAFFLRVPVMVYSPHFQWRCTAAHSPPSFRQGPPHSWSGWS